MPPKPLWYKKVRLIRASVEASGAPFVDRESIEALFGLKRRQAGKLLAQLPTLQVGASHAAPREAVLTFLRSIEAGEPYRTEEFRRSRVRGMLEDAKKDLVARSVRFAVPVAPKTIADLPETIRLVPGELRIAFGSAEDLLQQLFQLSRAMGSDFDRFKRLVEAEGAQR